MTEEEFLVQAITWLEAKYISAEERIIKRTLLRELIEELESAKKVGVLPWEVSNDRD